MASKKPSKSESDLPSSSSSSPPTPPPLPDVDPPVLPNDDQEPQVPADPTIPSVSDELSDILNETLDLADVLKTTLDLIVRYPSMSPTLLHPPPHHHQQNQETTIPSTEKTMAGSLMEGLELALRDFMRKNRKKTTLPEALLNQARNGILGMRPVLGKMYRAMEEAEDHELYQLGDEVEDVVAEMVQAYLAAKDAIEEKKMEDGTYYVVDADHGSDSSVSGCSAGAVAGSGSDDSSSVNGADADADAGDGDSDA